MADRLPLRWILAASLFLMALALLLAQRLGSMPLAVVYGLVLGASTGLYRTVTAVVYAHYFGRLHLGAISGAASTILVVGAALGPIPFALARDALGSYRLALTLLAGLSLLLGVTSLLMRPPVKAA